MKSKGINICIGLAEGEFFKSEIGVPWEEQIWIGKCRQEEGILVGVGGWVFWSPGFYGDERLVPSKVSIISKIILPAPHSPQLVSWF